MSFLTSPVEPILSLKKALESEGLCAKVAQNERAAQILAALRNPDFARSSNSDEPDPFAEFTHIVSLSATIVDNPRTKQSDLESSGSKPTERLETFKVSAEVLALPDWKLIDILTISIPKERKPRDRFLNDDFAGSFFDDIELTPDHYQQIARSVAAVIRAKK